MVPQPLTVATGWGSAALPWLAALFAAIAAGAIYYRYALRRDAPLDLRALFFAALCGLAIAWSFPVLFSSDVYAYAAYGEMARLGLNPYAHPPAGLTDPIVLAAQLQWVTAFPICLYGPVFVGLAREIVTVYAPFGILAQLTALRLLASAALLLCIPLAYWAYAGDRSTRLRAAATIGLNPAALWCAAEGHNDALALAVTLGGFALIRRFDTPAGGAAVVGLSASIKPPGAAAAAVLAMADPRTRLGALAGLAAAVAFSLPVAVGVVTELSPHAAYAPQASLQAIFAPLGEAAALTFAGLVAGLLALAGIARLRRGRIEGWIWLGLAAWALVPNPYPWYGLWLLALAALAPRSVAGMAAILLSFSSLLRYLPDAVGPPAPPLALALGLLAALPYLALCYNRQPA